MISGHRTQRVFPMKFEILLPEVNLYIFVFNYSMKKMNLTRMHCLVLIQMMTGLRSRRSRSQLKITRLETPLWKI